MLPGIIRHPSIPSSAFKKGDLVIIVVFGSSQPFALGTADVSSEDIAKSSLETKGKAITILHYFGDGLWQIGSKMIPPGFDFDQINPEKRESTETLQTQQPPTHVQAPILDVPTTTTISQSSVDRLLIVSFMDVAKLLVPKDLPMNASSLFSRIQSAAKKISVHASINYRKCHEIHEIPKDYKLELKNSSFKNIKGLMNALSTEKSYLSCKLVKNELVITSINLAHPDLSNFKAPEIAIETSPSSETLVQVQYLYSLNKNWAHFFLPGQQFVEPRPDRQSLIAICNEYMKSHGGNTVSSTLGETSKREFAQKFANDIVISHRISTELPPRIHKGNPPSVKISVKRIQMKKYATIVTGLSKYFIDMDQVAKLVSNKCAVSSSHDGNGELFAQGNLVKQIKAFLVSYIGIPVECIQG